MPCRQTGQGLVGKTGLVPGWRSDFRPKQSKQDWREVSHGREGGSGNAECEGLECAQWLGMVIVLQGIWAGSKVPHLVSFPKLGTKDSNVRAIEGYSHSNHLSSLKELI